MPQHVIKTHCIVGNLVLSKKDLIDLIRTSGKGIRAPKFIQVLKSLAYVPFMKICILDVDVIGNTKFHGKDW